MKLYKLVLFALFSPSFVLAMAVPSAFKALVEEEFHKEISSNSMLCMYEHEEVELALKQLLSEDETTFSPRYVRYLSYKKEYTKLNKLYSRASTLADKRGILSKMKRVKRDWDLMGSKNDFENDNGPLAHLRRIESQCRD